MFIDFSRILLALGYLLAGKVLKNEVLKNCMESVSLSLLFFVKFSWFWDALGGPRGGISRDFPRHPAPFFTPGCPKGPQRYPQSNFSSIFRKFQSLFELIWESFLSIFELIWRGFSQLLNRSLMMILRVRGDFLHGMARMARMDKMDRMDRMARMASCPSKSKGTFQSS